MPHDVTAAWDNILREISEIVENANGKHIRVCSSMGVKSMILVAAAMAVSKDITILYINSGRQSHNLDAHIKNVIKKLTKQDITIDIVDTTCTMETWDLGKEGSTCPVMSILRDIPENTIDIVGSVSVIYEGEKINHQLKKWRNHKSRMFPLWDLDLKTLFHLHKNHVPYSLQFPINSVTTCNNPLCPIIPDSALENKNDWKRNTKAKSKKEA